MEVKDEILIKVTVVDFDSNPYGPAVKVEVKGFLDHLGGIGPLAETVRFWIPRKDQPKIIVRPDNEIVDQAVILTH